MIQQRWIRDAEFSLNIVATGSATPRPALEGGLEAQAGMVEPRGSERLDAALHRPRLIGMVIVLFAVSVLVFLIFSVVPTPRGERLARQERAPVPGSEHRRRMGLRESLPAQYYQMMKEVFTTN